MKWKKFIVGYVLALAIFLFAQRHPSPVPTPVYRSIVDLTHTLNTGAAGHAAVTKSSIKSVEPAFQLGTRIDAPAQLQPGLWTVDQIPSERLIAPLVILNVEQAVKSNPDYQVSMDDIIAWERAHGEIPLGAVVMARTGWDFRWNSAKQYRNLDQKGVMHFPGYSLEAAQFLVQGRNVMGMGIDTPSIGRGISKDLGVQRYTSAHSLYHLDNVANLGAVPESGGNVVVAPAKLQGVSGGPVRILALVK